MAKLPVFCCLIALLALLGVANAHAGHDFDVTGKVYCDNCASGFPTRISPPIPGATVAVECKDRAEKRSFYNEERTDSNGLFSIAVEGEHEHESCEAYTISSPTTCNIQTDNNRGPVFLTHNNGINSNERKTGPFAFKSPKTRGPVFLTHNNGINSNERKTGPFAFKSPKTHPACKAVMAEYNIYSD